VACLLTVEFVEASWFWSDPVVTCQCDAKSEIAILRLDMIADNEAIIKQQNITFHEMLASFEKRLLVTQPDDTKHSELIKRLDAILVIIQKIDQIISGANVLAYNWSWCILFQMLLSGSILYFSNASPLRLRVIMWWFVPCVISMVCYYLIQLFNDAFATSTMTIVSWVLAFGVCFFTTLSAGVARYHCRVIVQPIVAASKTSVVETKTTAFSDPIAVVAKHTAPGGPSTFVGYTESGTQAMLRSFKPTPKRA